MSNFMKHAFSVAVITKLLGVLAGILLVGVMANIMPATPLVSIIFTVGAAVSLCFLFVTAVLCIAIIARSESVAGRIHAIYQGVKKVVAKILDKSLEIPEEDKSVPTEQAHLSRVLRSMGAALLAILFPSAVALVMGVIFIWHPTPVLSLLLHWVPNILGVVMLLLAVALFGWALNCFFASDTEQEFTPIIEKMRQWKIASEQDSHRWMYKTFNLNTNTCLVECEKIKSSTTYASFKKRLVGIAVLEAVLLTGSVAFSLYAGYQAFFMHVHAWALFFFVSACIGRGIDLLVTCILCFYTRQGVDVLGRTANLDASSMAEKLCKQQTILLDKKIKESEKQSQAFQNWQQEAGEAGLSLHSSSSHTVPSSGVKRLSTLTLSAWVSDSRLGDALSMLASGEQQSEDSQEHELLF